ncbi:hypothetical protein Fot_28616 [Forsythia ovata]|uniref:Uncharacterized protein n=1 Tax=Forsythia ovata TaxID=205694 RepID=A0ABD1TPI2_9LAMI
MVSVHKYWTSAFGRVVDDTELTELLKLAEMYTSCSHVLNCKLYKLLGMRIDEMRSTAGEDGDVEALRAENKDLRKKLAFSEDARARATYDIAKAQTIQKACVEAQKKAESQLKSCPDMVSTKDKELSKVLTELSKAQRLLAKLESSGQRNQLFSTEALGTLSVRVIVIVASTCKCRPLNKPYPFVVTTYTLNVSIMLSNSLSNCFHFFNYALNDYPAS